MTLLELIRKTTAFFEKAGVPDSRLDMELLVAHTLGLKRMDLYLQFERKLTESELDRLRLLVKRRAAREPLQHILGFTEFYGLEIACSPQALIPRPETEILVQQCLETLKLQPSAFGLQPKILDLGTGTGAIILAIAKACPFAQYAATDASEEALKLAKLNAEKNDLLQRIDFRLGNLFEPLKEGEKFDLIVSNPPYIPSEELSKLQPEVRHDPPLALDGGPDGLDVIRRLARESSGFLKPEGRMIMEIGRGQDGAVRKLLEENGWGKIEFFNDLQKIPRVVSAGRIAN